MNPDGSDRSVGQLILDVGYIDSPGSTEVLAYDSAGRLLTTVPANATVIITKAGVPSFLVRSAGVEEAGWAINNVRLSSQRFRAAMRRASTALWPRLLAELRELTVA